MAIGDKKPVVMESDRAVPNGIATLGTDGKLLDAQIPSLAKLGAAPAGFGWGDTIEIVAPEDKNVTHSEYCARLDAILVKMPVYTAKLITGYPPETYGKGWSMCVLGKYGNNSAAFLRSIGHSSFTGMFNMWKESGVWSDAEWINPPMVAGEEYRTTERYEGKPVYQAAFALSIPASYTSSDVVYPTLANGSTIMAVDLLDSTVLGTPTDNGQRRFIPQTGEPTYTVGHAMTEMCQVFASIGTTSAGGAVGLRYFFGTGISPHGKTLIGSVKYTKE